MTEAEFVQELRDACLTGPQIDRVLALLLSGPPR